jgi:autotransporter translocation and assembly factor TamB
MTILLRLVRWVAGSFMLLVALGVAALVWYTHTDGFREFARHKLLSLANDSIRGKISIAKLEGSVWGNIIFSDVIVTDGGSEIVRIPRLRIDYSLVPLLLGRVQIFRLEAFQPRISLKEQPAGVWNIVEALSPVESQTETPGLVVSINYLGLRGGSVDVNLFRTGYNSYRLPDLNLDGSANISPAGISIELGGVSSGVLGAGLPEARVKGAIAYQNSGGLETLSFSEFGIESGSSRLQLTGKIKDLQSFDTEARVSLDKLAPSDVARFVPRWPLKENVSGTVHVRGPLQALDGDFSFSLAGGSLAGKFHADVTQDNPQYQGNAKFASLNLARLIDRKELAGVLTGLVELRGRGFALPDISGRGEAHLLRSDIAGWNLGDIFLQVNLEQSEAKMTGQLKGGLGQADWQAQIVIKENPQYELSFSANQLDIQKLAAKGNGTEGQLNLEGMINGSGLTLATMNAQAKINLRKSTIGAVKLEQGTLTGTVANQRIRVSEGSLKAADAMLTIRGDIGTDLNQQGKLDYQLRVGNLSPWLALIDYQGSGALVLVGQAQGNLSDLKAKGKITASSLSYRGTAVQRASMDYDLGYSHVRPFPYGTVNLNLADVGNGYRLQTIAGFVRVPSEVANVIELNVKARDAQGRSHTVAGNVKYEPELLAAQLTQLSLDLPNGLWRLSQPVTVTQRGADFMVDRFSMRSNGSQVLLDGRFSLAGSQALRLDIQGFPIESVRVFFPDTPDVTGILAAQLQLGGTAAAPEIQATAKVDNSKIAGFSYGGLVATGSYRNQKADLNATVRQDDLHQLSATASLPMTLAWSSGWRAEVSDDMEARVRSAGLSLAFLNAFSGKAVQGIGGEVEVDLQMRGSLKQPLASGFVRLRDGKLTPTVLGIQISSITAEGLLEPRGLRISQLSARANKGELNGSGFIALQKFSPQAVDFSVLAKQWPAINTQQYQVEVNGAAKVDGTIAAPRINGKFEVARGELRPDLSFLERSNTPVKRDPTIKVVSTQPSAASAAKPEGNQQADSELWGNSAIDVQVNVPNNVWLRHRNATVELSGNLRVMKARSANLTLKGVIESIRGWVGFQGRRFTLIRARLEFTGGEKIDPALDILAEHRVTNYLVKVIVTGTAEKPTLTLTSDPQLDQADILSLLLFNKPVSELNKGEQVSLQQNAIGIVGGFAATKIGQAVAESLGLQNLGVDIGSIDFSGEAVRFGQFVGRDTFISFSQEVSGKYGQEISVQYHITSEWKLSVSSSTTGPDGIDLIWSRRY